MSINRVTLLVDIHDVVCSFADASVALQTDNTGVSGGAVDEEPFKVASKRVRCPIEFVITPSRRNTRGILTVAARTKVHLLV